MRLACFALFVALTAGRLHADLRTVTKITIQGKGTVGVSEQYFQGQSVRVDQRDADGLRVPVFISNADAQTMYRVDEQAREYVELGSRRTDVILSLAQWIARPRHVRQSDKTVTMYREIIDTGERKTFFGQTAKHLILHDRRVAEPGACLASADTQIDGWYIPQLEANPMASGYNTHLVGSLGTTWLCSDRIVSHGDLRQPGFPVLERHDFMTTEIVQFSRRPLDRSLFQVPVGFKKVDVLSREPRVDWWHTVELEWGQLAQAAGSWFE